MIRVSDILTGGVVLWIVGLMLVPQRWARRTPGLIPLWRVVVMTGFAPYSWLYVTRGYLVDDLGCGKGVAWVLSGASCCVLLVAFSAWVGSGMDRAAHGVGFYGAQAFALCGVPASVWIAYLRGIRRGGDFARRSKERTRA